MPLALLALAVLLYALYFSLATIQRYQAFESRALDMGNLNQTIWNLAHGNGFRLTNQQPDVTNRLSLHVEPILLPIALLYRLYPTPELLLVLQAIVVALGALPLFALARQRRLGDWMGLVFGVAFLLNPAIQSANWLEFHPLTLAPTFLMAAFYFMLIGRNAWFAVFAVLAASCKEEIGLLVFMIGLYAWVFQGRRRLGMSTMALALAWSLLAVFGIQVFAGNGNIHWERYDYLGIGMADKMLSLFTRWDLLFAQLQQANVLRYFFLLLLPVGFTALLAPEVLFLALPSMALNLLADFPPMHEVVTLIYAAPIVPFVLLASVMGVTRLRDWVGAAITRGGPAPAPPMTSRGRDGDAAPVTFYWLAALLVLAGALASQRLYGYLPGSANHLPLEITEHHRRAQAIIDQIPPDATVSAQDRLNPHVSGRQTVHIFPRIDDADTVLVDVTGSAWPQHPNDLRGTITDLLANGFGVAAADDGYLLLRKGMAQHTIPESFYSAWLTPPSNGVSNPVDIRFGDELRLIDYAVEVDRYGELVISSRWEVLKPVARDLRFYFGLYDEKLNVLHDSQFYQPSAVLWYPTSMWAPGKIVELKTLPWALDVDRFALGIGVYAGESGWNDGVRVPVNSAGSSIPLLEGETLARVGGFQGDAGAHAWQPTMPGDDSPAAPLDALFGDSFRLAGVTLPPNAKVTEPLTVQLYWRVDESIAGDYNRFVHLLDDTGNKVAQAEDGPPSDQISMLPTYAWPAGWRGTDAVEMELPADLPVGTYALVAGLYDWQTGNRVPTSGADADVDDTVRVGTIAIER